MCIRGKLTPTRGEEENERVELIQKIKIKSEKQFRTVNHVTRISNTETHKRVSTK